MQYWFLVEATVAFVVLCADAVGEDPRRPFLERVIRSLCWPVTLTRWFTHRNLAKLSRFGAIIWLLVTTGWLLSLERDRIHTSAIFLTVAETTLAFVVYCVDAMAADLRRRPLRRLLRSVVWVRAYTEFLSEEDSIKVIQASVTTWVLLTTGWLLSLELDRIARPLGWIAR